ncbi:hypothetical protein ACT8ZS_01785 [Paenibacillus sp. M.A.Huq-84]
MNQRMRIIGDLLSEFESVERIKQGFELTKQINELMEYDYFVFGAREVRILEGGRGEPSNFPIAIIYIRHKDNFEIQKISLDESEK